MRGAPVKDLEESSIREVSQFVQPYLPNTGPSTVLSPSSYTVPFSRIKSAPSEDEVDQETIPGHAIPRTPTNVRDFLIEELSTDKLSSIYEHLWMCGRRNNIHPLHWHRMMSRTIVITENPALHLVWYRSIILIKPLPSCLLIHSFWKECICPSSEKGDTSAEWKKKVWKEANGFLWTYTRLIVRESDFRIAKESCLVPDALTWSEWSALRYEIANALSGASMDAMTPRYQYGELRLARLDLVYRVFRLKVLGYHYVYRDYRDFFNATFGWVVLLFAYLAVATSSFQNVIGFDNAPQSVKDAGYWFNVAILLLLATGVAVQVVLFIGLFLYHLVATLTQPMRGRGITYRR
ncbi:hypothetical protein WOLCODRAFT_15763 [Wolfiporia cocos MD-104 SS10]|uniref:Uncharacterized protein n=1 Tax=Wolfiporia cocos (strain MD-104) TaxID=742152 RepID=A0A2H3JEQ6_WOLCO|nr:hypothetical protein WOLCODRAFT_15763 [Wolfiporia cocos MD-104 SS10]